METKFQAVYVPPGRVYRGRLYLTPAVPPDDFSLLTAVVVCVLGAAVMWLGAFL